MSLQELLSLGLGLAVDAIDGGTKALDMLRETPYSVVITDLRMPKGGGMKLIEAIDAERIPVTVIVTTGHGSIGDAVEAMRRGAYDFLTKPPDPQHLCLLVKRALEERTLRDEVAALRRQLGERHAFQNVLSRSAKMHDVFDLIGHVAESSSTVLIRGETGTGKEQIAQAIHRASEKQRPGPFVAVNCGALNENLLESELFGHEKGSYTGADRKRIGRFETAHSGTLFLDEIGDVPMSMQVKLLRVLQERRIERVGGLEPIDIDVRVIAATHQDMERHVKLGKFREDLYYRLNVVRIDLPPLRDRPEDVPVLAAHFCEKYARRSQPMPAISPEALAALAACPWPGNVRQLENAIERACITARDGVIRTKDLPQEIGKSSDGPTAPLAVDLDRPLSEQLSHLTATYEEKFLRKAMRRVRGHVGKCAELTGLSRRSVTEKIAQYGIDKEQYKRATADAN